MAERDELGAVIGGDPKETVRQEAAQARRLLDDPALGTAARRLTQQYMTKFCELKPDDPNYERMCVRTQIAVNIVADVIGQLGIMYDTGRVDDETVKRTMRGNANGR